jgi:hypothetical protein
MLPFVHARLWNADVPLHLGTLISMVIEFAFVPTKRVGHLIKYQKTAPDYENLDVESPETAC